MNIDLLIEVYTNYKRLYLHTLYIKKIDLRIYIYIFFII